ncbi:hypothetical protein RW1_038_00500 [Rhodococcus wratislaviensis NBRC 100605]|uniref:Uncharacterized protein n=1 Tax=Rhodococcus wratislaviensis NBRC 100605 TaxID=1219028 RepID=X0PV60_RHOWR|nr:hypothetical protein RW1_038_00500 [Rhodococcus wratislaviensis NBRC 100605]
MQSGFPTPLPFRTPSESPKRVAGVDTPQKLAASRGVFRSGRSPFATSCYKIKQPWKTCVEICSTQHHLGSVAVVELSDQARLTENLELVGHRRPGDPHPEA